ncbi:hypothetical protein D3C76_640860 [compost metagenome]
MNIAIFGASGPTGLLLTEQALQSGHKVTAFVRHSNRMPLTHNSLQITVGNVLQAKDVELTVAGQDAILLALGASGTSQPHLCSEGTRLIVQAMKNLGVRRIVALTGVGTSRVNRNELRIRNQWMTWLTAALFWKEFRDKVMQDRCLRGSGLDWTIIQPQLLTDGPWTGRFSLDAARLPLVSWVSRADVAGFMLQLLESRDLIGQSTVIYSKKEL